MDLFIYPLIGALLLCLLLIKWPRSLSMKLRIQFVVVSTLLVLLALLLFSLYDLLIATLAFVGLFLLFGIIIGKQLEYEQEEREMELAPVNVGINLMKNKEQEVIVEVGKSEEVTPFEEPTNIEEVKPINIDFNEEDEFARLFEDRPRRVLAIDDEPDELGAEDDDELPIRVPYEEKEDRSDDEDNHVEEAQVEDEFLTRRARLFEQLEENEK